MDFGDILSQWDNSQKKESRKKQPQVSHKKANAPTKEEKEAMKQGYSYESVIAENTKNSMNVMDVWMNRHGVMDKDRIIAEAEEERKLGNLNYLKSRTPDAVLDLHQLTRDEAWERMTSFVNDSVRRGFKKIMFIHGKGNHSNGSDPVLGQTVRQFIEKDQRLGTSGHPNRNHGGNGATWVIIK